MKGLKGILTQQLIQVGLNSRQDPQLAKSVTMIVSWESLQDVSPILPSCWFSSWKPNVFGLPSTRRIFEIRDQPGFTLFHNFAFPSPATPERQEGMKMLRPGNFTL